jgi:AcrR family transcriptional regulator
MGAEGPAALRLQDVARQAGVSHPTISHHFGSREGLVKALHLRALERLRGALLQQMGNADSANDGVAQSFAAFRDGMAQRILWLLQMPGGDLKLPPGGVATIDQIAQGLHALRVSFAPPGRAVDYEDSRAVAHLVAVAAFGDALIGGKLRALSGQNEEEGRRRFERWLSALIDLHVRSYWN